MPNKQAESTSSSSISYEIKENISFHLYGYSGIVEDNKYPKKLIELAHQLWPQSKTKWIKP